MDLRYVITGGGSGIGRALAIKLARMQKKTLVVGRRLPALRKTQSAFPELISTVSADITTEQGICEIEQALGDSSLKNCLINNAGIADPMPLSDLTHNSLNEHLNTNFTATTLLTQKLLPHLKGGRVLFISSGLAHNAGPGMFAYGTSKAALYNGWKYWKSEHPEIAFGIAQPGMVDTPIQTHLRNSTEQKLPMLEFFKSTHEQNQLLTAGTTANFLSWLLLNTTDDAFSNQEWNIYDDSHWSLWAKEGEVIVRNDTSYENKPS